MLIQILIYPYLNKTLGGVIYGQIILQQIIILHLQMLVFFGTDLSAVRLASKYAMNPGKLKVLVSKIVLGRLYLAFLVSLLYACYILFSKQESWYYFFIVSIFEAVFTLRWFYHGVQQLNKFSIPYCVLRLAGVLLIFCFVKSSDDWYKVVIITVVSSFLSVLFSWAGYYKKYGLRYIKVKVVYNIFLDSFSLFITNLVSVIKDRSGGVFIGVFLGPSSLVYYDFCIKIVGVISSITSSISAALFPGFSGGYKDEVFRKYNKYIFIFSFVCIVVPSVAGEYFIWLVDLIFKLNLSSIKVLFPVFGFMIFVRSHGYYLGLCYLMANNYKKRYASSLIISGAVYIVLMGVVIISNYNSIYFLGGVMVISLAIEYFHRLYLVFKTKREMREC